ncbi:MAG: hypothetical protein WDZ35_14930 [Crocinitomicaceae bacterium]
MKKILTIILYVLPAVAFSQEFAEFSLDSSLGWNFSRQEKQELPDYILDQMWIINGNKLTYDSERIRVEVDPNRFDTLLYKGRGRQEFDTIICNITEAGKYQFVYNECCGAFNVQDEASGKFIQGKVIYKIASETQDTSKQYLGTLGETAIMVNGNHNDTLEVECRSAMSPNVYHLTFRQIENCNDTLDCDGYTCLHLDDTSEPIWEFAFKTVSKKMDFLYMPLSSKPLIIIYDPAFDKIILK